MLSQFNWHKPRSRIFKTIAWPRLDDAHAQLNGGSVELCAVLKTLSCVSIPKVEWHDCQRHLVYGKMYSSRQKCELCASSPNCNRTLIGQHDLAAANGWASSDYCSHARLLIGLSDLKQGRVQNWACALLRVCTHASPQRLRLATGAPNFLWEIKPLQVSLWWKWTNISTEPS